MSSADQAVGAPERLHPLYLVTGLGRGLRQMVGGYAAIGYFAATGSWRLALLMLGRDRCVSMVVGVFLYWRRFEYRVGANEIRIDSGILNRTHRSIPFDRIQDVDISQGPLARLLGLARVKFETGGSAGDKEDDGALAAIALARAEALRDQVRARRGVGRSRSAGDAPRRGAAGVRHGPAPGAARRPVQFLAGGHRRPVRRDPDHRRCRRVRFLRAPLLARRRSTPARRSPT